MLCEELELAAITVAGDQNGHGTPAGPTLACEEPLKRGDRRYTLGEKRGRRSGGFLPASSLIIGAVDECRGVSVREQPRAWIAQDLQSSLSDL
jgi:hypothetical protein